jgi:hypothetical protein
MVNHTALASRDAYDWIGLAVNVAVAVGTLALAWLAYHELRSKRTQSEKQDRLLTLEKFIVPLRDLFREIRSCIGNKADPFKANLAPLIRKLDDIVLQGSYHYAARGRDLLNRLATFKLIAQQVTVDLRMLQDQSNTILDDLGSRLSGDTSRRAHPRAEIHWKGRRIETWGDADFLGMWMHQTDVEGWLVLSSETYKGGPFEVKLFHENNAVATDHPQRVLTKQLYAILSEKGFGNLFGIYGELLKLLGEIEKELGKAWLTLSRTRQSSGPARPPPTPGDGGE